MSSATRAPGTVAIVDDERDIADLVGALLERTLPGVAVQCFYSSETALAALSQSPVDAVLTDYRMPTIDGFSLIAALAKRCPATRFVLMTAFADSGIEERALSDARVVAYVRKSDGPAAYVQAVQRALVAAQDARESVET